VHSNGFSLVRKVLLADHGLSLDQHIDVLGKKLGEELLIPTKIYVKPILSLLETHEIKAMAHITGGGFTENIPRVLPEGTRAEIDFGSWPILPIFSLVEELGQITKADMFRTFNMGIGMVLAVRHEDAEGIVQKFQESGEQAYVIGRIAAGEKSVVYNGVAL
jgi:phosphoribosylformylglycinamidine cyclo-ligase